MAYMEIENGRKAVNILDSEVGLITKTRKIPASLGVADGKYKIVKAGTVYPSDTSSAEGIVFEDVDVTDGDALGSIIVAGRVLKARVSVDTEAETALKAGGLYLV